MTESPFALVPFPGESSPPIKITGTINRKKNILTVHYLLSGNLKGILFPNCSAQPKRKVDLWKETCCELFFAAKSAPAYWECNFSPSGDWNIYRMDAYRRIGFREEALLQRLQLESRQELDEFVLDAVIDLNPIFQDQTLEVGISAIIQTKDEKESYWALAHPASQADFHRRESFLIEL